MGAAESKNQMSPPQTPLYLKYSHLREVQDPRSPSEVPRTPVLTMDDQAKLIDPRSPTSIMPRTPIFCIPVPEQEDNFADNYSDEKLVQDSKQEQDEEENKGDGLETLGPEEKSSSTLPVISQVESSPEKSPNSFEISDKGYLIKKSKANPGNKKRRRRRRNKKANNNENFGIITAQKSLKDADKQVKRSPLTTRNFVPLEEIESPSLEMLVKNTKRLSLNPKQKALRFGNKENLDIGKENLAATFTP